MRTEIDINDPSFVADSFAAVVDGIGKASVVASKVAVVDDDKVVRAEIIAHDPSSVAAPGVAAVDGNDKASLARAEIDANQLAFLCQMMTVLIRPVL